MARVVSEHIRDVLPNVWLGTSVENAEVIGRQGNRLKEECP
jgi:protein gp37